jgi:hypothetical protein
VLVKKPTSLKLRLDGGVFNESVFSTWNQDKFCYQLQKRGYVSRAVSLHVRRQPSFEMIAKAGLEGSEGNALWGHVESGL